MPEAPSEIDMNRNTDIETDTETDTDTNRGAMVTLKRNKPPTFSGKKYTTADVNLWIFKITAYVRSSNDDGEKVEVAAGYLSGTADKWFMGKYTSSALPTFDAFIAAFKA